MPKTPYDNDSRLLAALVEEFRQAGVDTGPAQRHARRAVALVRQARRVHSDVISWAPGDTIPACVVWVYDLDGDVWERPPAGRWKMTNFDPDDVEQVAGKQHDDQSLLDNYGPVTGTEPA
jgi:hypothetical protein